MKTILPLFLILIFLSAKGEVVTQKAAYDRPKATLAGRIGGKISRRDFVDSKKLVIKTGSEIDSTWRVTEFKLSFLRDSNEIVEFDVKGDIKPLKIDTAMMYMPAGTKIYIEFIKGRMVTGSNQRDRLLSPLTFVLTDD